MKISGIKKRAGVAALCICVAMAFTGPTPTAEAGWGWLGDILSGKTTDTQQAKKPAKNTKKVPSVLEHMELNGATYSGYCQTGDESKLIEHTFNVDAPAFVTLSVDLIGQEYYREDHFIGTSHVMDANGKRVFVRARSWPGQTATLRMILGPGRYMLDTFVETNKNVEYRVMGKMSYIGIDRPQNLNRASKAEEISLGQEVQNIIPTKHDHKDDAQYYVFYIYQGMTVYVQTQELTASHFGCYDLDLLDSGERVLLHLQSYRDGAQYGQIYLEPGTYYVRAEREKYDVSGTWYSFTVSPAY